MTRIPISIFISVSFRCPCIPSFNSPARSQKTCAKPRRSYLSGQRHGVNSRRDTRVFEEIFPERQIKK